jgi:hypothetical protein
MARFEKRLFQALEFLRNFVLFEAARGNAIIGCAENKNLPMANSCGNRNSTINFFSARGEFGHTRLVAAIGWLEK